MVRHPRAGRSPDAGIHLGGGNMCSDHGYTVYIMSNQRHGTLYIGVTNDLFRRVAEHRAGEGSGFVRRYGLTKLVYYEHFLEPGLAIYREKRLKKWKRAWKIALIERENPRWDDLFEEFLD